MKINPRVKLVLRDVYLYDIKSCHFTILKKLGYDVSSIEREDKIKRNIQIGYILRDNPNITTILRKTTESLVDEFILRNHIKDEEIISRQYDGLILTKPVHIVNQYIDFGLRDIYQKFIISFDRSSYIALNNNNKTIIKGVSNRYDLMDQYYSKLLKINFLNKTSIFKSIENIKNEIINCENPELFCIPSTKDGKYEIYLLGYNKMEISETVVRMMDTDDVDKELYFIKYLEQFVKSIIIEFI